MFACIASTIVVSCSTASKARRLTPRATDGVLHVGVFMAASRSPDSRIATGIGLPARVQGPHLVVAQDPVVRGDQRQLMSARRRNQDAVQRILVEGRRKPVCLGRYL